MKHCEYVCCERYTTRNGACVREPYCKTFLEEKGRIIDMTRRKKRGPNKKKATDND